MTKAYPPSPTPRGRRQGRAPSGLRLGSGPESGVSALLPGGPAEALAIQVGQRLRGDDVVGVCNRVVAQRRAPKRIFVDNLSPRPPREPEGGYGFLADASGARPCRSGSCGAACSRAQAPITLGSRSAERARLLRGPVRPVQQ